MADFAGVSRAVYMSYENGKRTPDAEVLFNIAARFGLNMSVFFENDYYRLLSHIENGELYDDGLVKLINNYKELSSFSKGMLIEILPNSVGIPGILTNDPGRQLFDGGGNPCSTGAIGKTSFTPAGLSRRRFNLHHHRMPDRR